MRDMIILPMQSFAGLELGSDMPKAATLMCSSFI